MLRVNNLRLNYTAEPRELEKKLRELLKISPETPVQWRVAKKSVDARKKNDIKLVWSLDVDLKNEDRVLVKAGSKDVVKSEGEGYVFPALGAPKGKVIVAGAGPAGLFCAMMLARKGADVTVLERGRPVEQRNLDVQSFWKGGELNVASNVQFGEGGAGTFSDGKLTCGIGDPRLGFITSEFITHGAPADIDYLAKPHIGTDRLRDVVKNLRVELVALGVQMCYESKLVNITQKDGRVCGVKAETPHGICELEADFLVLATGHSARDTFKMVYDAGAEMIPKNMAVGVRIEHLQRDISRAQYGEAAGHPNLPTPDYKLFCHLEGGRSVFTFCVCPGGTVVASASEPGGLVTNGMSEYARDGININGGLLVGVAPEDFGSGHPLAGIEFQRKLEKDAFALGGSNWLAPAQLVGDFLEGRASVKYGKVTPSYKPGVTMTDIRKCLPEFVSASLSEALPILGRKLKGFDDGEAVLTAVESRSSSPVRIVRDDRLESSIKGMYPCGEGAGFAGGIMSAAADGIRCAERVYEAMCC